MAKNEIILTPEFRVSYPNVFRPQMNDLSKTLEYSVVALFPKGADLTALKKAAQAAIHEKWGTDQSKWPKNLRTPFRDQAEREKNGVIPPGHEAGAIFLTLKAKEDYKPGIVDASNQDIIDPSQFYAGCWARAGVVAYAYLQKGNAGVSFGLRALQKLREGDPLGGAVRASDIFEPVAGAADAPSGGTGIFD